MRLPTSLGLAALAAGVFCLAVPVLADIHTDKSAIQSVYDQCDSAADGRNSSGALARFGDPQLRDFESKTLGRLLAIAQSPHFSTDIVAITRPGSNPNEAVVVVTQHFHGFLPRKEGGIQLVTYDAKLREYWIRVGQRWQTDRTRLLGVRRTRNGQAVTAW